MLKRPDVELLPLLHSIPLKRVTAWNLRGSDNLAKLIPYEEDKVKYLVSEMGLHLSVAITLMEEDLIVVPNFQTALFYRSGDNGPLKAIKIFDQRSISEISKVKKFKRRTYVKSKFNFFFHFPF